MAHAGPLHYSFEDRTGLNTNTDFDDIYDRLFFHVARVPHRTTTLIYRMEVCASRHRDSLPFTREPSIILDFLPDESLGNLSFVRKPHNVTIPMARYLQKTSLFGGSLSRKFIGSDGRDYKWTHRTIQGQEWSCTTAENYLVAHYDLKPPHEHAYNTSGNRLVIDEAFHRLSIEFLASLTIMRHIAQHNL